MLFRSGRTESPRVCRVSDIFAEVDEELRADKAQQMLKKYGAVLIAAAVVVVLAVAGWQAWRAATARDFVRHRRWMVRNFSLSLAAVTLRIWLPAAMLAGFAMEEAYPLIAWLCWVPNLLLAWRWESSGQ